MRKSPFHVKQLVKGWIFRTVSLQLTFDTLFRLKYDIGRYFGSRASNYGLAKLDSRGRAIQFAKKPKGADLKVMAKIELTASSYVAFTSDNEL
ncbi:unnamed protein product [Linum trigynum]|uniref:Uncharacterized protein n=1 Tax=Linum trigynum TaxID=586398 RepID=A0AAV2GHE4_9ROSI